MTELQWYYWCQWHAYNQWQAYNQAALEQLMYRRHFTP